MGLRSRNGQSISPTASSTLARFPGCVNTRSRSVPSGWWRRRCAPWLAHHTTCRIVGSTAEPFGIIGVFVASQTAKDRLPQQRHQSCAACSSPCANHPTGPPHRGQTQRLIQFPIGQQPRIGGDLRRHGIPASNGRQNQLEEPAFSAFTHWILRFLPIAMPVIAICNMDINYIIAVALSSSSWKSGLRKSSCWITV